MKALIWTTVLLTTVLLTGCHQAAVRDANVYSAEIDFVDAAIREVAERGRLLIERQCQCVSVDGVKAFLQRECYEMAETVLVLEARMVYHTAFMRYLGGLSEDKPGDAPPDIEDPVTLCPGILAYIDAGANEWIDGGVE
jgi:hypothetical protein